MRPHTNKWVKKRVEYRFMQNSQRTSQHGIQTVRIHTRTTQKTEKMRNTDPTIFLLYMRYPV